MSEAANQSADSRELVLTRDIALPPERLFKAWTHPELLKQWFAPKPWTTPSAELDVRPGGSSRIVMRSPEGREFPNQGVYLEVVPNQRLVFTNAYTRAWEPFEHPFMTVVLTFEDLDGSKTCYTARVLHWTVGRPREARGDGLSRRLEPVPRPTHQTRQQDLNNQPHTHETVQLH